MTFQTTPVFWVGNLKLKLKPKNFLLNRAPGGGDGGGDTLLALANVFKKHLREYATKVLIANLPKTSPEGQANLGGIGGVGGGVASMKDITKDLKDFSTSGLIQNFQSLLKEGDPVRLTDDEKVRRLFLVTTGHNMSHLVTIAITGADLHVPGDL